MYDIVYESCPWHTRVCLLNEKGKLLSVRFEDDTFRYTEGTVCVGRVRKVMKSLNAAFVDIGDLEDGFLPLNKVPKSAPVPHEGQEIIVRITRGRERDKGARLSANVIAELPEESYNVPCILDAGPSALSRVLMDAGVNPVRVWILDARFRTQVLPTVQETKIYQLDQHQDVDLLDVMDDELESLNGSQFKLPSGGRITIERTKALTSIDVDSYAMKMQDRAQQNLKANMEAASEISRLCRVLNIGGSVIVDFISSDNKPDAEKVVNHLKTQFAETDARKVDVLKMSRFGLLEFNREMLGESLLSLLKKPAFIAGDIMLKLWRIRPNAGTVHIEAAPEVADILKGKLDEYVALAQIGARVDVKSDTQKVVTEFSIFS